MVFIHFLKTRKQKIKIASIYCFTVLKKMIQFIFYKIKKMLFYWFTGTIKSVANSVMLTFLNAWSFPQILLLSRRWFCYN